MNYENMAYWNIVYNTRTYRNYWNNDSACNDWGDNELQWILDESLSEEAVVATCCIERTLSWMWLGLADPPRIEYRTGSFEETSFDPATFSWITNLNNKNLMMRLLAPITWDNFVYSNVSKWQAHHKTRGVSHLQTESRQTIGWDMSIKNDHRRDNSPHIHTDIHRNTFNVCKLDGRSPF